VIDAPDLCRLGSIGRLLGRHPSAFWDPGASAAAPPWVGEERPESVPAPPGGWGTVDGTAGMVGSVAGRRRHGGRCRLWHRRQGLRTAGETRTR
jgi:hypothetical protein